MTPIFRRKSMNTMGIRLAKAHLSQLVRDAAQG
jgi:antitoxin (DNA-binding transcriptional repressor) of toxin-antitoxin stability system